MMTDKEILKGQISRINDKLANIHHIKVVKSQKAWRLLVNDIDEFATEDAEFMITYLTGFEKGMEVSTCEDEQ